MKKSVFILILFVLITGCQPGQVFGPELTATSTLTLTPTITATPTLTATPTITSTPTITPTPTATKVGGGSGLIIGNCSSIGEQIYLLDLANNEYKTAHELTKTPELWEADYVMSMSPSRDQIIWRLIEYRDIVTGWNGGAEYLKNYSSHKHQDIISNGNFSDNAIPYKGEIPDLWLPGDVGLFIEEDLSEEFISNTGLKSHPDLVYIGDFDGKNKKLLGKYLYARWETGELSPDNKYYVFPSIDHNEYYGPGSIIIVDLQTRTLEDYPYYMYGSISWAPDSSRFIYHGTVPDGDKQKSGLFLFDMNNRQVQFYKEDAIVVWSPDGEWLAGYDYGSEKDFAFIMRPDGTDFTTINLPAASIRNGFEEFYWLSDNSGLYIITNAYRTESTQFNHLFFYDLANEQATFIHEFSDHSFFSGRNIYPSPDEKWIILKTFGRDESMMSLLVVLTYWDVCNIEGCVPYTPPGTSECRIVEWAGPYPPNYIGALFGTR